MNGAGLETITVENIDEIVHPDWHSEELLHNLVSHLPL